MFSRSVSARKLAASALFVAAAALLIVPHTVRAHSTDSDEHAAARAAYNKKIAGIYNYKFGPDGPFLP